LVKRDLHRKEESKRHEQRRVKEHLKQKKLLKSSASSAAASSVCHYGSHGTSSADGNPSQRSAAAPAAGGSAPAPGGLALLDPLDSAYVSRNGQQRVEKEAMLWDWNDGSEDQYSSPPAPAAPPSGSVSADRGGEEEEELCLRKADLNDPYLDGLHGNGDAEDEGEGYSFSENYLRNSHHSAAADSVNSADIPFTPYLPSPVPSALAPLPPLSVPVLFPPIDSIKSSHSVSSHKPQQPSQSQSLSVCFAQMISSQSRPHLSIGKTGTVTMSSIPSAVEKVLKRRKKTTQPKSKEDKK
jgi:hypothetical protein